MRTPPKLFLALLLSSCAAGSGAPPPAPPSRPPAPSPAMTASAPPAPPAPLPPPATVVPSSVAGIRRRPGPPPKGSTTETVTIPTDGHATVLGLEIQVRENIEKRDMDGSSFMRIHLHVKAGRDEADVALTSETVFAAWMGYEIEYTGGWRQDLSLKITRLP